MEISIWKGGVMRVLSLFDGISCGQQALKELKIPVEKYYSSEIDKYAIAVTQYHYPKTIQLGDIGKWREWDIDWNFDLVMGGSPCTGFSFAGKQLNFNDPRSKLFFVFVDILNHIKKFNSDVKFLLENVRMKKEYSDKISEMLGVDFVMINSALVSAQNRVRLYWVNWEITQPKDRGILLKDILEGNENKVGAMRGRYIINGKRAEKGLTKQRIEIRKDNKSNTLTTVQKDNLCIQVGTANLKGHDSIKRVYSPEGKSPTLTTMGGGHREPKVTTTKLQWRKLTPLECERLQTLPDNYTLVPHPIYKGKMMSNSQRYKMLGNGWTVEVIKHILGDL